jgi:hypothetical protein
MSLWFHHQTATDFRSPRAVMAHWPHRINVHEQRGPSRAIFSNPFICDVPNDRAYGKSMSAVRDQASSERSWLVEPWFLGSKVLTRDTWCTKNDSTSYITFKIRSRSFSSFHDSGIGKIMLARGDSGTALTRFIFLTPACAVQRKDRGVLYTTASG